MTHDSAHPNSRPFEQPTLSSANPIDGPAGDGAAGMPADQAGVFGHRGTIHGHQSGRREIVIDPTERSICYAFGGRPAITQVVPGDLLHVRTLDWFGGAVLTVDDLPSKVCPTPGPLIGPFHVVGAHPGDTLAVHIVSLNPASAYGFSATTAHVDPPAVATSAVRPLPPEQVWHYDVDPASGIVRYTGRASDYTVDLPFVPTLGTVGVAPAHGDIGSTVADVHGGNLNTPLLGPGVTLFLGVNQPGALLAVGDGHARRGNGEGSGPTVEVPMDVVLVMDVIAGVSTPTPRMESDSHLLSIGVGHPLEVAYRNSQRDLTAQVTAVTRLDPLDAEHLTTQAAEAWVGGVTGPNYTFVAGINRRYSGNGSVYGGVHKALRAAVSSL